MNKMFFFIMLVLGACAHNNNESLREGHFTYEVGDTEHTGYIQSGAKMNEKVAGVLVVHEWWGHNEYAQSRVDKLAKLGYVAMSIDMYGEGKQADHPKDAGAFAKKAMSNFDLAKKRFTTALEILKKRKDVDSSKLVAIGYCFGGGVVLNMARSGVDLDLIASFHGSLASEMSISKGYEGKILVFNGEDDPMVKEAHVKSFKKEMNAAGVDFYFKNYPNTVHAFTNKKADMLGKKFKLPLAYNKAADEDSWSKFISELKEI